MRRGSYLSEYQPDHSQDSVLLTLLIWLERVPYIPVRLTWREDFKENIVSVLL